MDRLGTQGGADAIGSAAAPVARFFAGTASAASTTVRCLLLLLPALACSCGRPGCEQRLHPRPGGGPGGRAAGGARATGSVASSFTDRLDLRLVQAFSVRGTQLRVVGDLMNLLNLMNDDWGRVWHTDPVVPILAPSRDAGGLTGHYTGPTSRDRETGRLIAVPPYSLVIPDSQWQAQIGGQVSF